MSYLEEVKDRLSAVIEFEQKKMFGAFSFVKDTATFGFVKDDIFYFRTDERSVQQYIDAGSTQFNPMKNKGMPYWSVPDEVYSSKAKLKKWAQEAFEIALEHKLKKK